MSILFAASSVDEFTNVSVCHSFIQSVSIVSDKADNLSNR